MRKKVAFIFWILLLNAKVFSQDSLFFRDGRITVAKVKQIGIEEIQFIKYSNPNGPIYKILKTDLNKIKYVDGFIEDYSKLKRNEPINVAARENDYRILDPDTIYKAGCIFKFHLTSLLANKLAVSYERPFKTRFSWETQLAFIFPNPVYHEVTQFFFPNIAFWNQGFEIKTGFNSLTRRWNHEKINARSNGFFISYRYQHSDNVNYWTGGISGKGYHYSYNVSQTKNLIGVFYKRTIFSLTKKVSFDKFLEFGFYAGYGRTVCFHYSGGYGDHGDPMRVYNVGLPFDNGFVFMPVVRVGFVIRVNSFNNK